MEEKETGVNIVAGSKFGTRLVVVVAKVISCLTHCLVSITHPKPAFSRVQMLHNV
jgi:hypothetical protein